MLHRVIARAESDPEVLALIPFGSQARGEAASASDVDVCMVLEPDVAVRTARAFEGFLGLIGEEDDLFEKLAASRRGLPPDG